VSLSSRVKTERPGRLRTSDRLGRGATGGCSAMVPLARTYAARGCDSLRPRGGDAVLLPGGPGLPGPDAHALITQAGPGRGGTAGGQC
jgi:hypothetical protein